MPVGAQTNIQTPITADSLKPTALITLPPAPDINTGAGIITGGNAEIDALIKTSAAAAPSLEDEYKKLLATITPVEPNYAGEYQASDAYQKEQAITAKQQAVNASKLKFDIYSAQLKGIENKAKEQSLILENQN